jgi:hypothetical protein
MCPPVWLRCEFSIDHLIAQDIPISDLAPIPAAVDPTDAPDTIPIGSGWPCPWFKSRRPDFNENGTLLVRNELPFLIYRLRFAIEK